jgi:NAD(P)-dependent dehydrogenase (short-subunit alcohol dehydrogenase family)
MDLKNKVALVTGAGRGIGKATALVLAEAGANVVINDIDINKAESVSESLQRIGIKSAPNKANVAVYNEVDRMINKVVSDFGQIDILVNNAGITKPLQIEEMTEKEWNEVLGINLTGVFFCCKAAVPHMKKRRYGRIINISSLNGRTGRIGNGVHYSAAKAGILGLTMCLAREVGKYGVTVNAVAPGPILTELTASFPKQTWEKINLNLAMEREGKPEDIANAVLFLASDKAGWITGEVVDVNGGIYM